MITVTKDSYIPPDLAANILTRNASEHRGVFLNLDKMIDLRIDAQKEMNTYFPKVAKALGDSFLSVTERNKLREALITRLGIPQQYLLNCQSSTLESIISKDWCTPAQAEILQYVLICMKTATTISELDSYMKYPLINRKNKDGDRLLKVQPKYNVLTTGRLSTSDPNIQGVSKSLTYSIIDCVEGQHLRKVDSSQVEPRINYSWLTLDPLIRHMIVEYDDAYYGLLHYCTASPEEVQQWRNDISTFKPSEITDDLKALRSELKTLMLAVDYGGEATARKTELGRKVLDRLKNHPIVLQRHKEAEDLVYRQHKDTCYTYFGRGITPQPNSKYKSTTDPGWLDHLKRAFINNPLQGTAADLMNISVYTADKFIRELAISPLTWIGTYIHDAGLFYIGEDDLPVLDPLLTSCLSYQVINEDGSKWIPIYGELEISK